MDLEHAGTLCHQTGRRERGREESASALSSATSNIAEFRRNSNATSLLLSRAMHAITPCVLGSPSPAVPMHLNVPSLYVDGDEPTSAGAVVWGWGLYPLCQWGQRVLLHPKPTAVLVRTPLMDEAERCPLHIAAFAVLLLGLLHLLDGCWELASDLFRAGGSGMCSPKHCPEPARGWQGHGIPRALAPGRGGERETAKIDAASAGAQRGGRQPRSETALPKCRMNLRESWK